MFPVVRRIFNAAVGETEEKKESERWMCVKGDDGVFVCGSPFLEKKRSVFFICLCVTSFYFF